MPMILFSWLNINFHKSEITCFDTAVDKQDIYAHIISCNVGGFPFEYLGIPRHFKHLTNTDWKETEDKIEKKTASWKGDITSIGSRLVLI